LTKKKILAWADAHHERTGKWPNVNSGAVMDAPGEKWDLIDNALRQGHRGQPGGSSLLLLLVKKRGVRNPLNLPRLTEEQILRWADLHFQRFGTWPKYNSGPIVDAAHETWAGVDSALNKGKRELTGGSSLAKLLHKAGRCIAKGPSGKMHRRCGRSAQGTDGKDPRHRLRSTAFARARNPPPRRLQLPPHVLLPGKLKAVKREHR
jgi:hypothetical protein